MRQITLSLLGAVAVAVFLAHPMKLKAADDIVGTAEKAGSFKTLVTALQAAGLVDTLQDGGPYTVFAPTDEAFAKLADGTVESLLRPQSKKKLIDILTYHVVAGEVTAAEVVELSGAKTLNGQRVDIDASSEKVTVDQATVVKADIRCSNGIIHVVDGVLRAAEDTIPETAQKAGKFRTLLAALETAGLAEILSGEGPFTVFAPTDEAFAKLPEGSVESLLKPENRDKLSAILKYHVIPGRVYADEALDARKAKTLQGKAVHVSVQDGEPRVNKANLIATDIDASNGVIHVIDAVLLPPEEKVDAAEARRMIQHAVARGSQLYNHGHHGRCANFYMSTIREMTQSGDELPASVRSTLISALSQAEDTHCPKQQSWTMRRGLNRAYHELRADE